MGRGKVAEAHSEAIERAMTAYFRNFGYVNDYGWRVARCQLSGLEVTRREAVAHHKTPASELRKAGVEDLDAPKRLLFMAKFKHRQLHGDRGGDKMGMGRPTQPLKAVFALVEMSTANMENGQPVELRPL